jgi:hypothetical protein
MYLTAPEMKIQLVTKVLGGKNGDQPLENWTTLFSRHFYEKNFKPSSDRVARWFILRPKNPNLGIFWRALVWKMLVYFTAVWYYL